MSDERLRELERRFKETGTIEDEATWLLERVRAGELVRDKLRVAADLGHQASQLTLSDQGPESIDHAICYSPGLGFDLDISLGWYRKAAAQKNARAQYKIGLFYEQGWAVPKDLNEALTWYKKAAAQGHALAGSSLYRLQTAAAQKEPVQDGDIEERLAKLKGLYDKGLITKDQYDDKSREILDDL